MRSLVFRRLALAWCFAAGAAHAQWMVELEKCADPGFMGIDFAIDNCTRAIKSGALSPRSLAAAHYNRAVWWSRKRAPDRALADLDESIRIDPERAHSFFTRGTLRVAKGNDAGAMADFDAAIRLDPKRAEAFFHRGQALLRANDPDRAIADFNEALRREPVAATYAGRGVAS